MIKGTAVKAPVEINWFEMEFNHPQDLKDWISSNGDDPEKWVKFDTETGMTKINTLEGSSYDVPVGYIVIRGIKGEYYPCEKSIFEGSYIDIKES